MKPRVLVVDDSAFIRRVLTDWISSDPRMELAGVAHNGEEAVRMAAELKPDLITLDVEMPVMNGIEALKRIMSASPTRVIMVSSVTQKGAALTLQALELGAIDFFTKPGGSASIELFSAKDELMGKLREVVAAIPKPAAYRPAAPIRRMMPLTRATGSDRVVVIASSTGGPKALGAVFAALPEAFPAPIYIVQHMPAGFTQSFADRLNRLGPTKVTLAETGALPGPGEAVLAPGGMHMRVAANGRVELFDEAALHGVKPAADHLFHSSARAFGARCLAVVLTGMGKDGAAGALAIRKAGGQAIGESQASCVIYGMPKAAKEIGATSDEFAIEHMAEAMTALASRKVRNAA
jgi:two-component system chemotaxis response regulator CheB